MWYRQGAQQDGIDQAEYRNICSDSQRQRENCNCGEDRVLAQRAQRVPHILESGFQQMQSAFVSALLLDLRDASDPAQRRFTRCDSRHAGGQVLSDLLIEMELKLALEFVFNASVAEKSAQPVS
jgi:hypothetical protein